VRSAAEAVFGAALPLASRPSTDRYAPYRGQTVAFSMPHHPHYDAMLKLLSQFTRDTGIKVEVARENILRMKPLQMAQLAQANSAVDLVSYVVTWKSDYVRKNLIAPLDGFLANPALADPSFALGDIVPSYLQNIGLVGGPKGYLPGPGARLYGLPYGAETSVLAYRRDLFSQHGFKPPRTYLELQALLQPLREKTGIGALSSRGQIGHNCVHAWLLHLNPLGGHVFDADWTPTFQAEPGATALQLLSEIVATGPEGVPTFAFNDMLHAFIDGRSAMYLDSTAVFGAVRSSSQSQVDGKVAYALHPKGVRSASQSGGLGLAIARTSQRQEAAFLLMQWLTSKAQDKAVCLLGGGAGRLSTLHDAAVLRAYPEYVVLREQLRYADPDWRPLIAQWDEINTGPLGSAVYQGMTGAKAPRQALMDIVPRVNDIMAAARR
jgi:multiple sugar transport system substrate-binding protein